jgi:hypothetical protein
MSYNVTSFRLKSVSLTLPRDFSIKSFSRRAWHEIAVDVVVNEWGYNEGGEGFQMGGDVTNDGLVVTSLDCYSEGSGTDYHELLIPLFKEFKGDLEATVIWEGGDTIERLSIVGGEATETEIDI